MRIPKSLALGVVGALLAGAAQTGADWFSNGALASEGSHEDAITVPLGSVGDRVTFSLAQVRDGDREAINQTMHIADVRSAPDRHGVMHDTISVVWKQSNWNWTYPDSTGLRNVVEDGFRHQAYLLANRTLILEKWSGTTKSEMPEGEMHGSSGYWETYGPFIVDGKGFPAGAVKKFTEGLHQGATYFPGANIDDWALQVMAATAYSHSQEAVFEDLVWKAHVGTSAVIEDHPALPLSIEGCFRWSGGAKFLGHDRLPSPSKICFTYIEWVTAASPYAVRTESTMVVDEKTRLENVRTIVDYSKGKTPIPWGSQRNPGPAPVWERSPPGQGFPADGDSKLPFLLSSAKAGVESDRTLLKFNLWRTENPGSKLVGISYHPRQLDQTRPQWDLTYGNSAGAAYVVSAYLPAGGGPQVNAAVGEFTYARSFPVSDLPENPITLGEAERQLARYKIEVTSTWLRWGFPYFPGLNGKGAGPTGSVAANWWGPEWLWIGHRNVVHPGVLAAEQYLAIESGKGEAHDAYVKTREFRFPIAPFEAPAQPEPAPPTSAPKVDVGRGAAVSASLLMILLTVYFYPALKFFAGQVAGAWPGYAKTEKAQVLNHKVREIMVNAIRNDPGISPPQLQAITGATWTNVVYHLRQLEKNKIVSSLLDGRHRRYFPVDSVNWSDRDRISALRNHRTKELYDVLLEEPGIARDDVARRLGISRPATYWHLERLERTGLVGRDGDGRKTRFFAFEAGARPRPLNANDAVEVV